MNVGSIVLLIIIVALPIFLMALMLFSPHNTLIYYLFNWKYRMMLQLRGDYLWGLKRIPPDDYRFFLDSAISTISKEKDAHLTEALELIKMLQVEQFINHYFSVIGPFNGEVFYQMTEDFRSGRYDSCDYDSLEILKKNLPREIVSNEGALSDFLKFVNAGWFEKATGMYVLGEKRNHQYIGRAIYWICKRNGITSPERVFGPFWKVEKSKILEWKRVNKNEIITHDIDRIVFSILGD